MKKEYDDVTKNGAWKLVDPPFGNKLIGWKWLFKKKYKLDGSPKNHKTRLVAKIFSHK